MSGVFGVRVWRSDGPLGALGECGVMGMGM